MSNNYNIIPFVKLNKRSIVMILATSIDHSIGVDNQIPWSCKTDMRFFRKATTGHVVIMGRKTFESLNSRPLPHRVNIVVSTSLPEKTTGVIVVRTIPDAIIKAQAVSLSDFKRNTTHEHVFVIGGGQLYNDMSLLCNEILHSSVNCDLSSRVGNTRVKIHDWLDQSNYDNEILYYNRAQLGDDKQPLKEIVHYFKEHSRNKFELKDQL